MPNKWKYWCHLCQKKSPKRTCPKCATRWLAPLDATIEAYEGSLGMIGIGFEFRVRLAASLAKMRS